MLINALIKLMACYVLFTDYGRMMGVQRSYILKVLVADFQSASCSGWVMGTIQNTTICQCSNNSLERFLWENVLNEFRNIGIRIWQQLLCCCQAAVSQTRSKYTHTVLMRISWIFTVKLSQTLLSKLKLWLFLIWSSIFNVIEKKKLFQGL